MEFNHRKEKMEKVDSMQSKAYVSMVVIQFLIGFSEAVHLSNGVQERHSTNPYGKAPAVWTETEVSKYVSKALQTMKLGNKTDEWPGVNTYYKTYIDQYPSYVSNSTFSRLTSPPTGLNQYRYEYLGVCVNFQLLIPSDNTSYLGIYTCPLPFEPPQHTYCCGNDYAEYCCEPEENILPSLIGGLAITVPVSLFLFIFAICTCSQKKKKANDDKELIAPTSTETVQPGPSSAFNTEYTPFPL